MKIKIAKITNNKLAVNIYMGCKRYYYSTLYKESFVEYLKSKLNINYNYQNRIQFIRKQKTK